MRVETGPLQFHYADGEIDWPGVFIRGDKAAFYRYVLEGIVNSVDDYHKPYIKDMIELFGSAIVNGPYDPAKVTVVNMEIGKIIDP